MANYHWGIIVSSESNASHCGTAEFDQYFEGQFLLRYMQRKVNVSLVSVLCNVYWTT